MVQSKRWQAFCVSLVAFLVYLKTLAPSVTFIDSGELAAVACTLGVAHPTGYPLFTLLGWVFSKLPIAGEEIVRLNMMAAFFCALGLYFFYLLVHEVLSLLSSQAASQKQAAMQKDGIGITIASIGATMLLAFSETYWSQATSIEVYSLHSLFLSITLLCFFKAAFGHNNGDQHSVWWYLFAFTLGLSFTNHMTTILLAPGLIYLYFATQGGSSASWKRISLMGVPFVIGLSVYLYLPVRAVQSPTLNWGNAATLERFMWHFTGKQYRVWIFSSTEAAGRQLQYFLSSLPSEFAYVGLLVAVVGCMLYWRGSRRFLTGLLALFLTCVLYSINYDIHDIDSYFLLAYFCIALFAGAGFLQVFGWLSRGKSMKASVTFLMTVLVALVPLLVHYQKNDESRNHLVEDYTMNMFASVKPNALVLSYQWDYWLSASYYFQLVKGIRPDVTVVDKELLRRSWYLTELKNRFPWLINASREEVEAFKKELFKFEHDLPYNPAVIQARFVGMIISFMTKSMATRPVYVTHEIEPEFTQGLQRVPEGLALRVLADTSFYATDLPDYTYRPLGRMGRLEDALRGIYGASFLARARYYYSVRNDQSEARKALESALEFDPSSLEAQRLLMGLTAPGR